MHPVLTVKQLAEKLQMSPWTIYGWISQDFIPHYKLRGAVRFDEQKIEEWLQKNYIKGKSAHRLQIEAGMNQKNIQQ